MSKRSHHDALIRTGCSGPQVPDPSSPCIRHAWILIVSQLSPLCNEREVKALSILTLCEQGVLFISWCDVLQPHLVTGQGHERGRVRLGQDDCLQGEKEIPKESSDLSYLHNIHKVGLFIKYESHMIVPSQRAVKRPSMLASASTSFEIGWRNRPVLRPRQRYWQTSKPSRATRA
ncbi:hypothetical protein AUP68_10758 [Ilyonectria robusta]